MYCSMFLIHKQSSGVTTVKSELARANQNYPEPARVIQNYPELARAIQESPDVS